MKLLMALVALAVIWSPTLGASSFNVSSTGTAALAAMGLFLTIILGALLCE